MSRLVRVELMPASSCTEIRAAVEDGSQATKQAPQGLSWTFLGVDPRIEDAEIIAGLRGALDAWAAVSLRTSDDRLDVLVMLSADVVQTDRLQRLQDTLSDRTQPKAAPMRRTIERDPETGEIVGSVEVPA